MKSIVRVFVLVVLITLFGGCTAKPYEAVPLADLVSRTDQYDGKWICTEGIHLSGFETSALSTTVAQDDDRIRAAEPAVWLEGADIRSKEDCLVARGHPPFEYCRVTVCGRFEAGGRYGHGGGYAFQIQGK